MIKKILYSFCFFLFGFLSCSLFFIAQNKNGLPWIYLPSSHTTSISKPASQSNKQIYGVNVDMSQLLPSSIHYVVNSKGQDLIDIAHHLGINTFRITSVTNSFPNTKQTIYTKTQWDTVLNKMSQNGIKALILAESPQLDPNDFSTNYSNFVQQYILSSHVLDNPDVFAVDIHNEPLLTQEHATVLATVAQTIKKQYPQILITVGGWKTYSQTNSEDPYVWDDANAAKLLDFVDFYSIHIYGYDKSQFGIYPNAYNLTTYMVNNLKQKIPDKPILIGEFGAGNGDAITDQQTLGSKELQAQIYNGVYQAASDLQSQRVMGTTSFVLHQRDAMPQGWAIIRDNGNYFYPAAYVLQRFATGASDIALDVLKEPVPHDYILTNSDDEKNIQVHIKDNIGLHIHLKNKLTTSIQIDNPTPLQQQEQLTYNANSDTYDVVFRATQIGKATITLVQQPSCHPAFACHLMPIRGYSVTVEVVSP